MCLILSCPTKHYLVVLNFPWISPTPILCLLLCECVLCMSSKYNFYQSSEAKLLLGFNLVLGYICRLQNLQCVLRPYPILSISFSSSLSPTRYPFHHTVHRGENILFVNVAARLGCQRMTGAILVFLLNNASAFHSVRVDHDGMMIIISGANNNNSLH